eukprot:s236_g40.t3
MSMPPTTDKAGFSEVDLHAVAGRLWREQPTLKERNQSSTWCVVYPPDREADISDKQGVDEDTLSHASSRTVEVMPRGCSKQLTSLSQIIERLPGPTTRFDRLLRESESLDLSAELSVDGEPTISLLFVRVDAGLLAGLEDDTIEEDKQRFSGGGFGGTESTRHVLLLPDGRILAKYHYESDYMEHSGDYSCTCCWEIAEGNFSPTDEPGCLCITWTGWAELRHRTDEPFGPGTITGNWEEKLIDAEHRRVPSTLVPTDQGILNLQKLCRAWAEEDAGSRSLPVAEDCGSPASQLTISPRSPRKVQEAGEGAAEGRAEPPASRTQEVESNGADNPNAALAQASPPFFWRRQGGANVLLMTRPSSEEPKSPPEARLPRDVTLVRNPQVFRRTEVKTANAHKGSPSQWRMASSSYRIELRISRLDIRHVSGAAPWFEPFGRCILGGASRSGGHDCRNPAHSRSCLDPWCRGAFCHGGPGGLQEPLRRERQHDEVHRLAGTKLAHEKLDEIASKDIRDQSNCGCCWAFAGAEAASDRMCIATKGKTMIPISAQDVCFNSNPDGCDGGQIDTPWQYIKERFRLQAAFQLMMSIEFQDTGAVSGGQYQGTGPFGSGLCSDFSLPHCHHHGPQGKDPYPAEGKPGCPSEDTGEFIWDKYYYKGKTQTASGEKAIQQMIMAGGPVETAFTVFSDFELYTSGIYHHVSGEMAGGHAVRMVGWGVDGGVKYWKVANSWNPYWGEKGFFRIRRGTNEGGIEDDVVGSSSDAEPHEGCLVLSGLPEERVGLVIGCPTENCSASTALPSNASTSSSSTSAQSGRTTRRVVAYANVPSAVHVQHTVSTPAPPRSAGRRAAGNLQSSPRSAGSPIRTLASAAAASPREVRVARSASPRTKTSRTESPKMSRTPAAMTAPKAAVPKVARQESPRLKSGSLPSSAVCPARPKKGAARPESPDRTKVFFGFDNFFVAYAGNVFKPVEYMAAMLLMVGAISALGSLLLATFCESFRKETASCSRQASPLKLFWFLSSGAFIALAQTCGCLSFSLDEVNSGPHQAVVVANVPLVGFFFYVYSGETPGGNSGELFISLLVL